MTLHITGTGWHGIKSERVLDPHQYTEKSARARLARRRAKGEGLFMVECDDGHWRTGHYALPANIAAALQPCPTCNGKSWVHEDRPGGYGIADPCPDCHEGHPTITVTVPCECAGTYPVQRGWGKAKKCKHCTDGRVERRAVIREVLPVIDVPDSGYPDDSPKRFIYISKADTTRLVDCIEKSDTRIDLPDAAAHIEVLPCTS
jgi:hypothetical protein